MALWYFFIYVSRLYTLGGRPVCGSTELENNQHYIAVGTEKFKALPYDHCFPKDLTRENNTSEGYEIWYLVSEIIFYLHELKVRSFFCFPFCHSSQDILPAIRKTRHEKDVVSTIALELILYYEFILLTPP